MTCKSRKLIYLKKLSLFSVLFWIYKTHELNSIFNLGVTIFSLPEA